MEIGYKVVRKIEGKWVSCRVHPKRAAPHRELAHTYGIRQITKARGTALLVFGDLREAFLFANKVWGITFRNEREHVFLCVYEPGEYFRNRDGCPWPPGTKFAREVCLLKEIKLPCSR